MTVDKEEQFFYKKLQDLGLRAEYAEDIKEQYGATHHRLKIKIFKDKKELDFTTGGFKMKSAYRGSAFEQGLRRLAHIEMTGRHQ